MKRSLLFIVASALMLMAARAQTVAVWQNGVAYTAAAAQAGNVSFSESGTVLTVSGKAFAVASIDSVVVSPETPSSRVNVAYSGSSATVTIPSELYGVVSATVSGANVTVTSTATSGDDIIYNLSGASANGSFTLNGSYKCRVVLAGLSLTSTTGAAINIQNGKRIDVKLEDGTQNTLADAAGGTQKACFFVKGHPEFSGSGSLTLVGNARHAFASNEYTRLKHSTGTITVQSAVSDAFHCGQYFRMEGGTVVVEQGVQGDGIQAEITKDATDENNGQLQIAGGSLTLDIAGSDVKGLKSDSAITITGGTINITARGAGSRGIQSGTDLLIDESSGQSTQITVVAAGGVYTDATTGDTKKCMGVRVDGNMTITAGTLTVTATGNKAKTVKVSGLYTKSGSAVVNAANMDI